MKPWVADNKEKRIYMLDILKIAAILMVVSEHMIIYSGIQEQVSPQSGIFAFIWILRSVDKCNINLFVLISGYFICAQPFKVKRIIVNILQVQFYSISGYGLAVLLGACEYTLKDLVKSVFPIFSRVYWFSTAYISLCLLAPILNCVISKVNQKQHKMLLFILYVVSTIYPNFFALTRESTGGGKTTGWFVVLYFTAAYVRKYGSAFFSGKYKTAGVALVTILMLWATKMLVVFGKGPMGISGIFFSNDSPLVYLSSLAIFMMALQINPEDGFSRRWGYLVEKLNKSGYAVYLVHDGYLRTVIWEGVNLSAIISKWYFIPAILGWPLMIYSGVVILDQVRIKIFVQIEKTYWFQRLNSLIGKLDFQINHLFEEEK